MARVGRTRTRVMSCTGTTDILVNGVHQSGYPSTTTSTRTSSFTDTHGRPVTPSALNATVYQGSIINVSGTTTFNFGSTVYQYKRSSYPIAETTSLNTEPLPAKSGWMLDLVSGTNPSRPTLCPPTLLQDLYTIPSQLRETGRLIKKPKRLLSARELADQYLCAQFGWFPLIEDVQKLLALQTYILKRNKELHDLYKSGGLKRRLRFEEDTQNEVRSVTIPAGPFGRSCYLKYEVNVKRSNWATIRWYPTTPPPYHPDDMRWNILATRLALGLTVEGMAKGAWDILPWTWLIGWFTNVGKYLTANSFTVPAQHSDGCLMRKSVVTYTPISMRRDPDVVGNLEPAGFLRYKRMTRAVSSSVTPGVNMPYLDMFKLSILSSLFVQKTMKKVA